MTTALANFRQKYPGYNDLDDATLAGLLAKKYPDAYGDLPSAVAVPTAVPEQAQPAQQAKFNINPAEMRRQLAQQPGLTTSIAQEFNKPSGPGRSAFMQTAEDIASVYPALEVAAAGATGLPAMVASGLAGVGQLGKDYLFDQVDLNKTGQMMQAIQSAMMYQPRTEGGQRLAESAGYPMTKATELTKEHIADPLAEAGHTNLAALAASAPEAVATLVPGGKALSAVAKPKVAVSKITQTVNKGMQKATTFLKKERANIKKTAAHDRATVERIVKDKDKIQYETDEGSTRTGTPETLGEFHSAISQSLDNIFKEYDALAKHTDAKGQRMNTVNAANSLDDIITDRVTIDSDPAAVAYAQKRQETLRSRDEAGGYTAAEAQDAIKRANSSLKLFQGNPSKARAGRALVDLRIAEVFRKDLDSMIKRETGGEYAALKREYGAVKSTQDRVLRAATKEANRAGKKPPNIADYIGNHQLAHGLFKADPAIAAVGLTMKGMQGLRRRVVDPNKAVKKMFKDVEKELTPKDKRPKIGADTLL